MKKRIVAILAALSMLVASAPVMAEGTDSVIYVSLSGSDNGAGTQASPVKTVAKAMELAAAKRSAGENVTIVFDGGQYYFDKTVDITSVVSGTSENSTIIKAEDGEEVTFTSAKTLDTKAAEAVSDPAILERLYENVRDKVVVIDLAAQGISQSDILNPAEVNGNYALSGWEAVWAENNAIYIDGVEQQLSRWPNDRNYATWTNGSDASFKYTDAAPSRWASAKDFWVAAFAEYDYQASRMAVKSIDTQNKKITVIDNPVAKFTSEKSKRWAAFNLLEEIDLPGEYYIDRENMKLYMYAPENLEDSTLEIALLGTSMLNIDGASNITFEGIKFANTRSNAVFMKCVNNVDFINCSFENIGVNGILVRGAQNAVTGASHWEVQQIDGSYNVDISGCNFYNIGMGAIDITGGNVDTLTKSNNKIENCFISYAAQKSYWEAISIRGCGITVKNNNISNVPMQVIRPWGSLHTIEYNEIYDALHENDDCGMIYWGGNSVLRGTEVNYNYLHDAKAQYNLVDDKHSAIYWDDLQSGMSAKNNIIKGIDGSSLFLNGAGAITHKFNTTVDSNKVFNLQNHAERYFSTVSKADVFTTIEVAKSEIADKELYYSTFDGLEDLLEKKENPQKLNDVSNNFSVGTSEGTIETQYTATTKNNQTVSSGDYFVNAAKQDYRIKASAASSVNDYNSLLNQDNFDIESIGLQRDFALNGETAGFGLVYPANGEHLDYTNGALTLVWNKAPGANKYKVTVAKDKEFKNVVLTAETKATTYAVTGLENTETYYWKVEAVNISRELGTTWANNGGAYKFSYADLSDFETPQKPENILIDPTSGNVFGNATSANGSVTKVYNQETWKGYYIEAEKDAEVGAVWYSSLAGVSMTGLEREDKPGAGGLKGKVLEEGKPYVISFLARNAGTTDSVNLNVGLGNINTWASYVNTVEKGSDGFKVADKENWTKVAGTLVAPSAVPYLTIGFPAGEAQGSKIEFNLSYLPEDAIYLAEEVAYEFNVEADKTDISAGESITVSAEVLNQVGTAGTLSQDFTWYAMDSEREDVISGITVTPSADSKTATVEFDVALEGGEYAIVAYSEKDKIAKGVAIQVEGMSDKYKDYIPGAKPANIFDAATIYNDPTNGEIFGNATDVNFIEKVYNEETWKGYFVEALKNAEASAGWNSTLQGTTMTNNAGGLKGKTIEKDKAYVLSFLVRNAGTTDSVNLNIGFGSTTAWGQYVNTVENGAAGFTITDKNEWTKVAGTLVAPSDNPYLTIGFPAGEAQGSKIEFNLKYQPEDVIYLAEEVAYDIKAENLSDSDSVVAGESFTASANVLNQVGTAYTGEQNITWYALDLGRTKEIPEITIVPTDDTKTATVTVGSGLESGKYVILAMSEEYGMAKGFEISVTSMKDRFKDYIPGAKPANIFDAATIYNDPTNGEIFGNATDVNFIAKVYNENGKGYFMEAVKDTAAGPEWYSKLAGVIMHSNLGGLSGKTIDANKAYVISFLARNAGITDSVNLNIGFGSTTSWGQYVNTVENGAAGFTITDKNEWTKVAGTLVAPSDNPYLTIGFPAGEAQGSKIEFNLKYQPEDVIYLAEEVAYDIKVSADKQSAMINEEVKVEASVLNQIGTTGALPQNFTWYVLNGDRTAEVSGFSIEESGNIATVKIGEDVETGNYTIVAVSDDYKMVKGINIFVQGVVDIYKDHIPGAKPANIFDAATIYNDPTNGEIFGNATDANFIEKVYNEETWKGYFVEALKNAEQSAGWYSTLQGITMTNGAGGLSGKTINKDKAYVISFLAKNVGTTDSVNLNIGFGSTSPWGPYVNTVENGAECFKVADKENWTKVAGTLVAPSDNPYLTIGFPAGEAQGSKIEFNLKYQPEDVIYLAEEVAYDIEISGEEKATLGETVTFDAKVINQVGTTGTLSQDIVWYAVNENRTAEVEGLDITVADGVATLKVSENVPCGNYLVIARSDEYNMSKSIAITVGEKEALFVDHIPGAKPVNILIDPTSGNVFGNATDINYIKKGSNEETWKGYFVEAIKNAEQSAGWYSTLQGITMTNGAGGLLGKTINKDKAYVISFLAKNVGTTDSVNLNIGFGSTSPWGPYVNTIENGAEGFKVADKENWTKVAGTLVAPSDNPYLTIGFPAGEAQGSKIEFNLLYQPEDAIYFAEEVAYDIEVSGDSEVSSQKAATVEASVLNQVGTTGTLSQNFKWYAVNEKMTEYVEGFTFKESEGKVEVSVSDSVEYGTYKIVAVSDDYGMAMSMEIAVVEPVYEVEDLEFSVVDGVAKATVTTNVANAKIFLASYLGTALTSAKVGEAGEELTLTGIGASHTVKVFAWDMTTMAPLTINPMLDTIISGQ